jgi:carbamoyltransferase
VRVVGISAYYHDSAAALVVDGRIVAAAQEERFSRTKHDARFPAQALAYCLREGRVRLQDVDVVCFYDKPFLKFERLLETYLAFAPRGFASFARSMPVWVREKLFQKRELVRELRALAPDVDWRERLRFTEHHLSHAASAFYPSPFAEAAVLTVDGVGEWATASTGVGRGHTIELRRELHFPHSLGLLYSAFTAYLGFRVNSGEYKVMGLAPYGAPRYADVILRELMDLKDDGSFRLDQRYFAYATGLRMTNDAFATLFDGPPRAPESALEPRHLDVAASIQQVCDEVVLRMTRALAAETGLRDLCLAGGVALNCVANGKVLRDGAFRRLWIQPAAGDAGGAVGAALAAYHDSHERRVVSPDAMSGALLGPAFSQHEVEARLRAAGAAFEVLDDDALDDRVSRALADGQAVGWVQGRMEFGPRALGARSILADARSPRMQSVLNLKVKFRESFRPFAPAVLAERAADWFELEAESPYMLLVAEVARARRCPLSDADAALSGLDRLRPVRSQIPAVTHVDDSARVQTVDRERNPRFHRLLRAFEHLTGCPVLVNTSFNVRGEPIVCTPDDALRCFLATDLDALAIERCFLSKAEQPAALRGAFRPALGED